MRKRFILLAISLLLSPSLRAQIYADFETTLGNFTCELNYTASPKTVANFVGLAEGSRAWIDPANGAIRQGQPFYDGLIFHRVIANFMNQSGSRNGLGTDGPGYSFRDETSNGLVHNAFTLSMANSGVHTNGSQFFITAVATSWLNGLHTVFGTVTSGQSVITTINQVPTSSSKPTTPVVIQSVKIRRVGSAAGAFDINAQNLPTISQLDSSLKVSPSVKSELVLSSPQPSGSYFQSFRSENLTTWAPLNSIYRDAVNPADLSISLDNAIAPKAFYRHSLVTYPNALSGPEHSRSRRLFLNLGGVGTFEFLIGANGNTGSLNYSGGAENPYDIVSTEFTPGAYRTSWVINTEYYGYLRIVAQFTSQNSTQYSGTASFEQYQSPDWVSFGSGSCTLSK